MLNLPLCRRLAAEHPHPLLFVTISGAHLYGFPSADSDFDLRGAHLLPGEAFWRLRPPRETEEPKVDTDAGLVEIAVHEGCNRVVRKMLERSGHPVLRLARTGVGPLRLGRLATGTYRWALGRATSITDSSSRCR